MSDLRPTGALVRNPWLVVLCAAAIVTLAMGVRQAFGLLMRPMGLELEVGREAFGLAIALQNLVFGVAQPFVGALADRHGAGRVAAVGAVVYIVGLIAAAQAGDALGLNLSLGLLIGFGLSGTTFVVVLGAVGRVVDPARRSLAFGLVTAGGSLGQFLVVPAAQGLIDGLGWRGALLALAGLVAVVAPLAIGVAGRPNGGAHGAGPQLSLGEALRQAAGHRGYWLINLGFFVCGFHVAFIATHLPAYLTDSGIAAGVGAAALALIGLFNIFGSYTFGVLGDHARKKNVLAGLYFARAIVLTVFLLVPLSQASALVFASAMGFLWLGTVPLTSGLVGQIFGVRYLSTLYGVVFMSHQIGSFFGAWSAGRAYDALGSYDLVWLASIGLALLAALVHLPIRDAAASQVAPAR
jgi:predicted MFS family arabinose efflux permease